MENWGDFSAEEFINTFHLINHQLWESYHLGTVDQVYLRKERFPLVMTKLGVRSDVPYSDMADNYLRWCPQKTHLMPGAEEALEYLRPKYSMSVITNGFFDVQVIKLSCSGLDQYFDHVFTSQEAGRLKPDPQIFYYAITKVQGVKENCIMIGDNPATDIAGAQSAGIDQIFYDPHNTKAATEPTYQIEHLRQLRQLL